MKKAKIFFTPVEGSAPLCLYWFDGPKGEAVEAVFGEGIGFFSPSQDMLGVIFDDVNESNDEQELFFANGGKVSIKVNAGKVQIIEVLKPKRTDSA